jgi:hypothetical protein
MSRFGLRERIAVGAVVASAAALLAVLVLVGPDLRRRTVEHTRDTLLGGGAPHGARGGAAAGRGRPSGEIDALVDIPRGR